MYNVKKRISAFIKKRPISIFLLFLAILLALIFIGNKIREPKVEDIKEQEELSKKVSVFSLDEIPRISVQAEIDKEGTVTLFSQKSGIASYIYANAGQRVYRGNTIAYISDTQFGANMSSVSLEIAKKQEEVSKETIDRQLSILKKQKEIIENTPTPTDNDDLQSEIGKKQIRINKENAKLGDELTELAVKQAQISNQMSRVSAPQNGVIEKIFVNPGQFVSPGTPIAVFNSDKGKTFAELKVPFEIAKRVSIKEKSYLQIGEDKVEAYPIYISAEATDSYLYSILFSVEDKYLKNVPNKSFITVSLALENEFSDDSSKFLIPLDSVHLTQENAFVFVNKESKAEIRELEIGSVVGQFVEVISGLSDEDSVIESRNIFDGDSISVE